MNASRKKRVAAGSGTKVEEINRLLKMHVQMADMMKKMGGNKGLMSRMFGGKGAPDAAEMEKMQAELAKIDPNAIPAELKDMMQGGALPEMPKLPAGLPGLGGAKLPGLGGLAGSRRRAVQRPAGSRARRNDMAPSPSSRRKDCACAIGAKAMSIRFSPSIAIPSRRRSMARMSSAAMCGGAWRSLIGHWQLRGFGPWALEDKATGRFAGHGGLWFPDGWGDVEVGYGIAPEFRGQGYAVEAAQRVRDYGYREKGLERLVSYIDPGNTASMQGRREARRHA